MASQTVSSHLSTLCTIVSFSIMMIKQDESKITKLSDSLAMAVSGEDGDTTQFAEFIAKNIQLYKMRNGYELSPAAAATYTRRNLADCLRSRSPYQVNLLLAGYDHVTKKPELYYMDHLAVMVKVPFAAHGHGSFFSSSILDTEYRPNMTLSEAQIMLKKCVAEIQRRLLVNLPCFKVVAITKDGTQDLPDIAVTPLK
ncbi:proteasome subunit beta type-2-like isoform X2 [Varroa jacobsoni]|uniref:proteasome subunit beta type-2-like isoform X2 n=1 Tax=Varroa jacobsoni TaxID=62625 RepID=UPI000BF753E5|nr:proteasome subunit beta type-2-like isoform X2 [Varroa jacobsoni]